MILTVNDVSLAKASQAERSLPSAAVVDSVDPARSLPALPLVVVTCAAEHRAGLSACSPQICSLRGQTVGRGGTSPQGTGGEHVAKALCRRRETRQPDGSWRSSHALVRGQPTPARQCLGFEWFRHTADQARVRCACACECACVAQAGATTVGRRHFPTRRPLGPRL